ncbi:tryptophanase [Saccharopolyspora spinosa]|uniref:Tryptophanase n=1 Tax=Saccharopolyspora spinosa TaxID=60894 RepID=A0A2N3Y7B4_SACSN|nr:tryptophanase [Saccharopolyspora spinosa]
MPHLRPFVAAVVRPIPITTREERIAELDRAGHNPFSIRADKVSIDLLSDSGTGAVSVDQQAWSQRADERYAGAESYYRFQDAVRDLVPYQHVLPVHQGRAAERVLFGALLEPGQISLSNMHFDTTRADVELLGAEARDLPSAEAFDLSSDEPFKGNIDVDAVKGVLDGPDGHRVGQILVTITNNGVGGHPVSMSNLAEISAVAREHGVPLILDAARFAENAWLVTRREPGYPDWSPRDVARRAFELADGAVASLKKDGLSHDAAFLAERLHAAGVQTVRPTALNAVYVNAGTLLPHLKPQELPDQALSCALYREGGIRCSGGSLFMGVFDENNELVVAPPFELVRLALPRRVYDRSHWSTSPRSWPALPKTPNRSPATA